MKHTRLIICGLAALSFSALDAQNLAANFGFELGTGTGTTRDFANTSNFFNRGTGEDQTQAARRENTDTGSSFVG